MNPKESLIDNLSASLQVVGAIVLCFILFPDNISQYFAVIPRELFSLGGIIIMPFAHLNAAHLASNLIPIAVMMGLLSFLDEKPVLTAAKISLLGSCLLWMFGRTDVSTIGASVLLFGLAAYLVVAGLKLRKVLNLVACVVVVGLYGMALLEGLIPKAGVSWDGHAFGLVAGAFLAWNWSGAAKG